jgi:hypothetical protein
MLNIGDYQKWHKLYLLLTFSTHIYNCLNNKKKSAEKNFTIPYVNFIYLKKVGLVYTVMGLEPEPNQNCDIYFSCSVAEAHYFFAAPAPGKILMRLRLLHSTIFYIQILQIKIRVFL